MPRPKQYRKVAEEPRVSVFKPAGIPRVELDEILVTVDEFEAIRLADFERVNQRKASSVMHVSQPTFNRILSSARNKVAEALVRGAALRIEGGEYVLPCDVRVFQCDDCGRSTEAPMGEPRPHACPDCGSSSLIRMKRAKEDGESKT
ncbi:MAG: DUF134 domain-containing protein [Candidatus Thorarchaeota archaeon]|jgi:predicted DNA-binding protein (UPF0251 family)